MADAFSREELSDLKDVFVQHDADGDGTVNTAELLKTINALDELVTKDEVETVIQVFDTDNDGSLTSTSSLGS
ncbi:hypothetical protein BGZ95_008802 [Linnemannia exigua]|uniref:EF-hand domain-containing protein n=1 Tax=Linnemannia exigua TaxID=604196 RepID=A0AAD4DDP2_9FUNG|nr:hypothetical protein BGZ95_008802 [Linnemannia exigua]